MKAILTHILILLLLPVSSNLVAQDANHNPDYDAALAESLGADDYGMKNYMLVILRTGSRTSGEASFVDSCFAGHMANIQRLSTERKLIVAGPLGKNKLGYRGIFILNTTNEMEAMEMLGGDPAIMERLLDVELIPWYGSAALPLYLDSSEKVWKKKP